MYRVELIDVQREEQCCIDRNYGLYRKEVSVV